MGNNISQDRMQIITNNLFAELKKAELVRDTNSLDLSNVSEQNAYKMVKPFFNLMTENLSNHITEEQFYDFLTEEVGLSLAELDYLELTGVIEKPDFVIEEER